MNKFENACKIPMTHCNIVCALLVGWVAKVTSNEKAIHMVSSSGKDQATLTM